MKTLHLGVYGERTELLLLLSLHLIQQHTQSSCPYADRAIFRLSQINTFYLDDEEMQWIDFLPSELLSLAQDTRNMFNMLETNSIFRDEQNEVCMTYPESLPSQHILEADILDTFFSISAKILPALKTKKSFTLKYKAQAYYHSTLCIVVPNPIAEITAMYTADELNEVASMLKERKTGILGETAWTNQFQIEERRLLLAEKRKRVNDFYDICEVKDRKYKIEIQNLKNTREKEIVAMFS